MAKNGLTIEPGVYKPEIVLSKKIFLLAAKKLDAKTEDCVFIDDYGDFLKVAESVGMKVILFKNSKELRYELDNLLNNNHKM